MATLQKRVLIVDDEEDLTWTLTRKLSKDEDKFRLICVNSGSEAISVLNQVPIDLVISDIRMPEVSGLELLSEIKRKYQHTKVIIMTAYGSADVQRDANERGCFRYIEKPFEINELRELILNGLAEEKGFKGSVSDFQLGDIVQLNCLGRLTSGLKVVHEEVSGFIYFEDGNIVHAETSRLEGENAFYHIMSWQGGEFFVHRNVKVERETIKKGWQSLLLEAVRRADEHSSSVLEEKERAKRQRIHKIRWALNSIEKAAGVKRIVVHNSAGFPITYLPEGEDATPEPTDLGNQMSNFLKDLKKLQTYLQAGGAGFMEIQFNKIALISSKVPEKDAFVTVFGDRNLNIGFVRVELRRSMKTLGKLI